MEEAHEAFLRAWELDYLTRPMVKLSAASSHTVDSATYNPYSVKTHNFPFPISSSSALYQNLYSPISHTPGPIPSGMGYYRVDCRKGQGAIAGSPSRIILNVRLYSDRFSSVMGAKVVPKGGNPWVVISRFGSSPGSPARLRLPLCYDQIFTLIVFTVSKSLNRHALA